MAGLDRNSIEVARHGLRNVAAEFEEADACADALWVIARPYGDWGVPRWHWPCAAMRPSGGPRRGDFEAVSKRNPIQECFSQNTRPPCRIACKTPPPPRHAVMSRRLFHMSSEGRRSPRFAF